MATRVPELLMSMNILVTKVARDLGYRTTVRQVRIQDDDQDLDLAIRSKLQVCLKAWLDLISGLVRLVRKFVDGCSDLASPRRISPARQTFKQPIWDDEGLRSTCEFLDFVHASHQRKLGSIFDLSYTFSVSRPGIFLIVQCQCQYPHVWFYRTYGIRKRAYFVPRGSKSIDAGLFLSAVTRIEICIGDITLNAVGNSRNEDAMMHAGSCHWIWIFPIQNQDMIRAPWLTQGSSLAAWILGYDHSCLIWRFEWGRFRKEQSIHAL